MALTLAIDFTQNYESKLWHKVTCLVACFIFGITIAYSRLIIGVHSLDQVLYGLTLGVWCPCFMQFCTRSIIDKEVGDLLASKITDFKRRIIFNSVVVGVLTGLAFVQYAVINAIL